MTSSNAILTGFHRDPFGRFSLHYGELCEISWLKVKGANIYILPLTWKPKQQRFTIQTGVLTITSSRQRSAISGHPLPKRTDIEPVVCS